MPHGGARSIGYRIPRMRSVTSTRLAASDRPAQELLRSSALLSHLSARARDEVVAATAIEHVPARTVLLREGEPPQWIHLVLEGLVRLFTTAGNRQITLTILRAPTLVPAEMIDLQAPAPVSACTLRRAHLGRIAIADATRLLLREREFAGLAQRQLAAHWRDLLCEVKSLRAHTSFQRLVAWILAMHRLGSGPIDLPYDKSVLAARLGMAPETLSRDFARLSSLGVSVKGRRLDIADPRLLETLAGFAGASLPPVP